MTLKRTAIAFLGLSTIVLSMGVASAQDFPSKPVRIVAGTVGGASDFAARVIAQGVSDPLGQPVIVDNRTAIQAQVAVFQSPPDGYSLLISGGSLWILPLLQKMPRSSADFSPVSLLVREVNVLVVHPSMQIKSVKELIALAKAKPGELNYSMGASGSSTHLAAELFKSMAGVNIVHIRYKGSTEAARGLISGEVHMTILDPSIVTTHIKSGKLRALAVTSAQPSALVPGLPTIAASGLPGYEAIGVTGIWVPAKTPDTAITRLSQEIVRVFNQPDVKEKFLSMGVEPVGSSPQEFAAFVKADIAKWDKVIKDAGLRELQ